jgi:hypothetical protein
MVGSKSDRMTKSLPKVESKAMGVREGELLWTPSAAQVEDANLTRFAKWLRRERGWNSIATMPCGIGRSPNWKILGTPLDRERRCNIGFARVSVHDRNSAIQDGPAKNLPVHDLRPRNNL